MSALRVIEGHLKHFLTIEKARMGKPIFELSTFLMARSVLIFWFR